MAKIYCGVLGESEPTMAPIEPNSRRRRLDLVNSLMFATEKAAVPSPEKDPKRRRTDLVVRHCDNAVEHGKTLGNKEQQRGADTQVEVSTVGAGKSELRSEAEEVKAPPKFGTTSVCGWRRDMEDSVSIHPLLSNNKRSSEFHFFGVFDGHGCSHVALKCKERFHEIMAEEIEICRDAEVNWRATMERSFHRMDNEVKQWPEQATSSCCRCDLQSPQCDAVGSTAVVAVLTPEKIIVANCGDSRAVLCRNGLALPLSTDHKPDRPDELDRIQSAGGRVIYWEGPRVLGVLAMSRAIGDNYLKPYVISEPEVVIMQRTAEDECLILASDGLWDVVNNETACGVARICLRSQRAPLSSSQSQSQSAEGMVEGSAELSSDKACWDASMLLTKLALARRSTDNVSVVVVDLKSR